MIVNPKQTSPRVASTAGKTLGNSRASDLERSLAGSAKRQAASSAQTCRYGTEGLARTGGSRSSPLAKTLVGRVVSQSNRKR